jgi:hypothetical protein
MEIYLSPPYVFVVYYVIKNRENFNSLHTFVENVWKGTDLDRDRLKLRDYFFVTFVTYSFIAAAGAD